MKWFTCDPHWKWSPSTTPLHNTSASVAHCSGFMTLIWLTRTVLIEPMSSSSGQNVLKGLYSLYSTPSVLEADMEKLPPKPFNMEKREETSGRALSPEWKNQHCKIVYKLSVRSWWQKYWYEDWIPEDTEQLSRPGEKTAKTYEQRSSTPSTHVGECNKNTGGKRETREEAEIPAWRTKIQIQNIWDEAPTARGEGEVPGRLIKLEWKGKRVRKHYPVAFHLF